MDQVNLRVLVIRLFLGVLLALVALALQAVHQDLEIQLVPLHHVVLFHPVGLPLQQVLLVLKVPVVLLVLESLFRPADLFLLEDLARQADL